MAVALFFQLAVLSPAAEATLKVADREPPAAIDASIRKGLQTKVVQILQDGKPIYEFWFASVIPLRSKPASTAKSLDTIKDAALLGAVSIVSARRDYRDDELAAGVYTMRFALQPEDGNHLGTAEFSYFAVLVSSKLDTKPDGITDFKTLVKASAKTASGDHPMILSLRPATSESGEPKINEPAPEHKSVLVRVPGQAGEEKASLLFEVVVEGKGRK